jgi:hypothetical protein
MLSWWWLIEKVAAFDFLGFAMVEIRDGVV